MTSSALKPGLGLALAASLLGCASVGDKQAPVADVYVHGTAPLAAAAKQAPVSAVEAPPAPSQSTAVPGELSVAMTSEQVSRSDAPATQPANRWKTLSHQGGAASVYDPWERFNRRMHRFNNAVDRTVARPVATTYVEVVPAPVRSGVSNFFDNLGQPATAANLLLQGKVKHSAQALGRFLVNSTVGVAGLFDPASRMKIPEREEDFGQTLATWGWRRSRYVELPFFGPSTVRDAFGMAGDSPLQPLSYVETDKVRVGLMALNLLTFP